MKHVKTLSKSPIKAADIPMEDLIAFITAILTAIADLYAAKETA